MLALREVAMLLFLEEVLLFEVARFRGLDPCTIAIGMKSFLFYNEQLVIS